MRTALFSGHLRGVEVYRLSTPNQYLSLSGPPVHAGIQPRPHGQTNMNKNITFPLLH